jgi:hypothetical protein
LGTRMDNPEKLVTLGTRMDNQEKLVTRRWQTKQKATQYVFDTTIHNSIQFFIALNH